MTSYTEDAGVALRACGNLVADLFPQAVREDLPLRFVGKELNLSRHYVGAAASAALGAYAYGISKLWEQRTGVAQGASIDLRRATVPGLRTSSHLWQNGHRLPYGRPPHESENFFLTRDGRRVYLLRISQYAPLVFGLLKFLGCANDTAELARAVAKWDSDELDQALAEKKLLGGIARGRDEWLAHPQGALLDSQPPVVVSRIGDGPCRLLRHHRRPLDRVRVLDMAHVLAGPVAARMLAEQGADVLHATAPLLQDDFRVVMDTGFGKRNIFLNLGQQADAVRARSLLSEADVFVQSFRPGSLDRRGFSIAELCALRPGLIYVSVSAYGNAGPLSARGGLDPLGQTVSGLAIAEGSRDHPVLAPTMTLNDYLAAYLASAGITAALLRRTREGGSYRVDVSLTRCSMWLQELGRKPEDRWPRSEVPAEHELEALDADLMESRCAYGTVRHAKPIVEFSATPAHWHTGPTPLGAARAAWLPESAA